MINSLKTYLNKPLPYVENNSIRFFMALFFGGFIFVFLWVFQPFGIGDYSGSALLKSLGYGVVTFVIMLINSFLLPFLFPKIFDPNTFKIKHNYIVTIWFLISIAISNWLYASLIFSEHNTISLGSFLFVTLAVGIFPMIIGGYYMEKKLNYAKQKAAIEATNFINQDHKEAPNKLYSFSSDNSKDKLEVGTNNLIFVKSDGNYCEFYFHSGSNIKKQLLRITLKTVEDKLANELDILQCHRSFIANLQKVTHVSGTARNLSLHFDNMELSVPVSRSRELIVTKTIRHMK